MHAQAQDQIVVVTHRRMLSLAIPMTLSQLTTPLLGFVGATVVGRLGDPALLGAVALGGVVFGFVFWTFSSLRMATTGLTAQAVGRDDRGEIDRVLGRSLILAAGVGILLIALQGPVGRGASALAGASPAVTDALLRYFSIRIYAAPFTLANYAILGSALGRGRADLGLLLQAALNLANAALTVALVYGAGLGIAGAALATVLAETGATALGMGVLIGLGSRPWSYGWRALLRGSDLRHMLAVNRDVMVRTAALMSAFALFAALGARSGDTILAANAVLENMFLIGAYFLDGFATAAETLCGQALGARREDAFRAAIRLSLLWSIGFGAAASSCFMLTGHAFIAAVSTNPGVRLAASAVVVYAAMMPLVGAAAFAFDGIYVGATWSAAMRNLMLLAFAAYGAALLVLRPFGNDGLWIGLLVFLAARGAGQALFCPRLIRATFAREAWAGTLSVVDAGCAGRQ